MAIVDLENLPETGPLLGIDPGAKTLGIAASDSLRLIASPVETISRGKKFAPTLARLTALIKERCAVGLIIGLPLNMDGTEGPRAQATRAFAHNILGSCDISIAFFDERLTSAQAERGMLEADLSRARRSELIDASAAAVILQTALDRLANTKT